MNNWQKVYSTSDRITADVLVALLRENDIEFNTIDKIETVTQASGLIEFYVKENEFVTTQKLLKKIRKNEEE